MPQKITESVKRETLERILKSQTFAHSRSYQELLTYLVETSIQNKSPKEFAIATEVLHKGADFDPSHDTIVRVYIYNLRKKLERYYEKEGNHESLCIKIPKGHYNIEFVKNPKQKPVQRQKPIVLYVIIALLVMLNIWMLFRLLPPGSSASSTTSQIWSNFMQNGHAKNIVLGDHFFYLKDSNDREKRTILRRDDINSFRDFQTFKADNIERRNYVQLRYPLFPRNSVWPMADIVRMFSKTNLDFTLEYCSNVKASDFRDKDMLFIGSFHTLGAFEQTFRNSHFSYQVYPNVLTYQDDEADTLVICRETGDPALNHIDFGLVRKIPGPNNKTIWIFSSFHETGTFGMVKLFTEQDTQKELEKNMRKELGHIPDFYEILFQASGYNRTVYATKIEKIFEVDPESVFW